MELSQLEVFLAVARERRFSRAAEKLYRTQSAVSQTIRKLEDELGEALFDRSSREGVLTDAGKVSLSTPRNSSTCAVRPPNLSPNSANCKKASWSSRPTNSPCFTCCPCWPSSAACIP